MKTTYQWSSFIVFWLDDPEVIRSVFQYVAGLSASWRVDGTNFAASDGKGPHVRFSFFKVISNDERRKIEKHLVTNSVLPKGSVVEWQGTVTHESETTVTFVSE